MDDTDKTEEEASAKTEEDNFRVEPEKLEPSYVSAVVEHINKKAISPDDACQVCGSRLNTVSNSPFKLLVKETEGAFDSGREMPLLATTCHNCGYTRLFNRILVDHLIEAERRAEAEKSKAQASEQGDTDGR